MVGVVDHFLHVQVITEFFADPLAIVQGHPARAIQVETQHPPLRLPTELDVDEFQPEVGQDGLG